MWQITAGVRGVRWQERKAQRGVTQGGRQGPGLSPGHRPWDPPVGEVAGRVEAGRESQGCAGGRSLGLQRAGLVGRRGEPSWGGPVLGWAWVWPWGWCAP